MTVTPVRNAVTPTRQGWGRFVPSQSAVHIRVSLMTALVTFKLQPGRPGPPISAVGRRRAEPEKIGHGNRRGLVIRDGGVTFTGLYRGIMRNGLPHGHVFLQAAFKFALGQGSPAPPNGDQHVSSPGLRHAIVRSEERRVG